MHFTPFLTIFALLFYSFSSSFQMHTAVSCIARSEAVVNILKVTEVHFQQHFVYFPEVGNIPAHTDANEPILNSTIRVLRTCCLTAGHFQRPMTFIITTRDTI